MSQPDPYARLYAFLDWSTSFPTTPHSGQHLDDEFNAIKHTLDETLFNLELIQRDDGQLQNGIVTPDSLNAAVYSLLGGFNLRGAWVTLSVYAVKDAVTQGGNTYVAVTAHTAGVFATDLAAGKWALITKTGIAVDGTSVVTADIPFNSHKLTAVAPGVAGTDAANVNQVNAALASALAADPLVASIAVTRVGTDAAKFVTPDGLASLTQKGSNIATAATLVKPADANLGGFHVLTGSVTVGNMWAGDFSGAEYEFFIQDGFTITNGANFLMPGGRDLPLNAGDRITVRHHGSDVWYISDGQRSDGKALIETDARNLLINGGFVINQRVVTTGAADDTYTHDRWNLLTQTGTITIAQQTDQENGTPFNIRLTQAQAVAQRMGLMQIVENKNCRFMRGRNLVSGWRIRSSLSQSIRYAILEWAGGNDVVTSDVVLDWTSASYTAGGFFLAANLNVLAVGSLTPAANTWTDLPGIVGLVGNASANLIVMIWTESTFAQNATLDIARARLCPGVVLPAFLDEDIATTLMKCLRYYWKSFAQGTAPATGVSAGNAISFPQQVGASTACFGVPVRLPVPMRLITAVTLYNPVNANAQVYNTTKALDCSGSSAVSFLDQGFEIQFTSAGATVAGDRCRVHATVEGEL